MRKYRKKPCCQGWKIIAQNKKKTDYNAIIFHGFLDRLRLSPMFERCVEQVRPLKVESITEKIAHTGG